MTNKNQRYLVALDFDGTLFDTFSPSPNNIGVIRAYELAITDVFGARGKHVFDMHGLQNRAPSQIVYEILGYGDGFLARAKDLYETTDPKQTGVYWNNTHPETSIVELFVYQKLKYLLGEIGKIGKDQKIWPQPCVGAISFLDTLRNLRQEGIAIDTAVISSGHEAFIKKTFDTWDIPYPNVLITEDDIRPRKYPKEMHRRFKPGQLPLALAHYKWLDQQGFISQELSAEGNKLPKIGEETRQRIIYFGDDIDKDFGLARGGSVLGYIQPFTPFQAVADMFVSRKGMFDGRPFREITAVTRNGEKVDGLLPVFLETRYQLAYARGKENL